MVHKKERLNTESNPIMVNRINVIEKEALEIICVCLPAEFLLVFLLSAKSTYEKRSLVFVSSPTFFTEPLIMAHMGINL